MQTVKAFLNRKEDITACSNYIYINLKGRDAHGIVEPEDKYALEEQIINDLIGGTFSPTIKPWSLNSRIVQPSSKSGKNLSK